VGVKGGRHPANLTQNQPGAQVAERNKERLAVQAVLQGLTYDQAAEVAGYEDRSGAYRAVQRVLAYTAAEIRDNADLLRAKMIAQLDRAMVEMSTIAYDRDNNPDLRLKALEGIRRNTETRARITGALQPAPTEGVSLEAASRELARLAQRYGLPLPDRLPDATVIEGLTIGPGPMEDPPTPS
jgi:hypothetical protein